MALTSDITIKSGAAKFPDGYTPPTLTPITNAEAAEFETDIAITEADAGDATTGLNNVMAAIKTFFDGTYAAGTLKLDLALTITANLLVTKITRTNTASSIFLTGTEVFRCTVNVDYA